MKSKSSSSCSQKPASALNSEENDLVHNPAKFLFKTNFNIILLSK
jgi:hypothetical protein